jgi:ketosteroid isomerase-like protein
MTLSIQEISDRLEIQDLLATYSHAIDSSDWDVLDDVFTDDALIDYTAMGGSKGNLTETKQFLAGILPTFAGSQHMVATSKITVDGDTAVSRTICHNPMILSTPEGNRTVFCGAWYNDRYVRTPDGWRIQERVEEKCYLPPEFGG